MPHLLSPSPTRRSRIAESPRSIASLKQRWRRAVIDCRLPIRRRFELIAMLEFVGGFNGVIAIGDAPGWAVEGGILIDRRGSYEFDRLWLLAAEAEAEVRWIDGRAASRLSAPMKSTREAAMTAAAEAQP